jgi:hypothetical protein
MTGLRQLALVGLSAVAVGAAASLAFAAETSSFQNRLGSATIGLPLGAAPPPGLYTGLQTFYLDVIPPGGASNGTWCISPSTINGKCANLPVIAQAVPLLWVPGWTFLGATYEASVVQGFYVWTVCGGPPFDGTCNSGAPINVGGFVYTNTFFNPITLSWKLGGGWFVSAGFNFTAPDGTRQVGTPNPDYWTFEPALAVSYVGSNWVFSANMFYDFNTRSQGTCCTQTTMTSGDLFYTDLTLLYKFGKWSIGPVGFIVAQTTPDTGCPVSSSVAPCGNLQVGGAGGLIGYDFGPVDLQVYVVDNVYGTDVGLGPRSITFESRIGFKVWGPEAPHPLVSKN